MDVNELESLRKKIMTRRIIGILLSLIAAGITLFFDPMIAVFVLVVGLVITVAVNAKATSKFRLAYKDTFVKKALESTFDDLVYSPRQGIDRGVIASTQMMDMGDRYSSNDYISGKYKDIKFTASDIRIEREYTNTNDEGETQTYYETIFQGQWMIFDFNKSFKYNLQVRQSGFSNARVNNFFVNTKYKKIEMEDVKFNNMFKIYAQSEHEAFYILTPHLMEKIENLVSSVRGKILLCFIDNRLHVGIQSNFDSFEHSVSRKIDEQEIVNKIGRDIKTITNFVDELDLDNNLFRKEV